MQLFKREAFLKALIVILALGILVTLGRRYGKPVLSEMSREKQDLTRIEHLNQLDNVLKSVSLSEAEENTVYISLPSKSESCEDLALPSLRKDWTYKCSSEIKTDDQKTNWLPFLNQKDNEITIPTDPINQLNESYYTVAISASSTYAISAHLDSKKYIQEKSSRDGGISTTAYEVGTDPRLASVYNQELGHWQLNESSGNVVQDSSKSTQNGLVIGGTLWRSPGIALDGEKFITVKTNTSTNSIGSASSSYSISLWVKGLDPINQSLIEKWDTSSKYPFALRIENGNLVFAIYDGKNWLATSRKISANQIESGMFVTAVRDTVNSQLLLYINADLVGKTDLLVGPIDAANTDNIIIGGRSSKGLFGAHAIIADVILFDKALSDNDVLNLFLQSKNYLLESR